MISDVLDLLVEEAGSEVAAARRIGVGPSTLNRWRHGLTYPGGQSLQRIASVTGATLEDLAPPVRLRRLTDGERATVLSSVIDDESKRAAERDMGLEPGSLG